MAGFTVVPFVIMQQLGGSARMVGIISALQAVSYASVSLISSPFVTRARNGLHFALIGLVGYTVLFCSAPLVHVPWAYAMLSSMGTGCMGLVWPALWSWVGGEPDLKERARRISHYNISWSIGLSLGPLLAGRLYNLDYRFPFLLIVILIGAVWALVASLPHEKSHYTPVEDTAEEGEARAEYSQASEIHLYAAWIANFMGWMLVGACRSVYAKRVAELVDAGELMLFSSGPLENAVMCFSMLVFAINASRAVVFFVLGHTIAWQHRLGVLVTFQAAAACAVWMLSTTHNLAVMILCCAVVGLNGGAGFFASVAYSLSNPELKHRRAAINEATVGSGSFSGSLMFGLLADAYTVTMPFAWAPAFVSAGVLLEWTFLRYGMWKHGRRV